MFDTPTEYLNWVNHELTPAAEQYADDFFKHLAATLEERATDFLAALETEEGITISHDLTVPVINAIILENMSKHCMKAAQGWRDLYHSGLNKHFHPPA